MKLKIDRSTYCSTDQLSFQKNAQL